MNEWNPISEEDFKALYADQYSELSDAQRHILSKYVVTWWVAKLRRTESAGDESVFVVAQKDDGVLYFDDIEYGFNISIIESGRITKPGGAQNTLSEAIDEWLLTSTL